jgi:hypothetical protein
MSLRLSTSLRRMWKWRYILPVILNFDTGRRWSSLSPGQLILGTHRTGERVSPTSHMESVAMTKFPSVAGNWTRLFSSEPDHHPGLLIRNVRKGISKMCAFWEHRKCCSDCKALSFLTQLIQFTSIYAYSLCAFSIDNISIPGNIHYLRVPSLHIR